MPRRSIILILALTLLWATKSPSAQRSTNSPARDLVGTWTLASMERLGAGPASSPVTNPRGLLVYDAAGHALEIATRGGRALYAAAQATPAEAQTTFASYYGVYSMHAGAVHHRQLAVLGPGQGNTLRRFFEITGPQISLKFPPGQVQGQGEEGRTVVTLKRLSGEADMLPR